MLALRHPAFALAVLVATGSPAYGQREPPLHFLSKQCNEDAIAVRVDPGPFQQALRPASRPCSRTEERGS